MFIARRTVMCARQLASVGGGPRCYHTDQSVRVLKSTVISTDPEFQVRVLEEFC